LFAQFTSTGECIDLIVQLPPRWLAFAPHWRSSPLERMGNVTASIFLRTRSEDVPLEPAHGLLRLSTTVPRGWPPSSSLTGGQPFGSTRRWFQSAQATKPPTHCPVLLERPRLRRPNVLPPQGYSVVVPLYARSPG